MGAARVLIVDDDPELRCFLRTELELEGYACGEAATGQQALMQARGERWDLLLLDWTLPDFSGVELCRRLRGTDDRTPVLMLTARDDVKERVEALDAGADDYLTKPFSIEELLARVRARLRRGPAEADEVANALQPLRLADLELNTASREVRRTGQAVARHDPDGGVGRALGGRRQRARCVRAGAAAQAGAPRHPQPDPDGARRGLHAQGGPTAGVIGLRGCSRNQRRFESAGHRCTRGRSSTLQSRADHR